MTKLLPGESRACTTGKVAELEDPKADSVVSIGGNASALSFSGAKSWRASKRLLIASDGRAFEPAVPGARGFKNCGSSIIRRMDLEPTIRSRLVLGFVRIPSIHLNEFRMQAQRFGEKRNPRQS